MINWPDSREGEHAEAPAGDEAHDHAADEQEAVAEQSAQHVGARRNLRKGATQEGWKTTHHDETKQNTTSRM